MLDRLVGSLAFAASTNGARVLISTGERSLMPGALVICPTNQPSVSANSSRSSAPMRTMVRPP